MKNKYSIEKFLAESTKMAGRPITFVIAVLFVLIWLFAGLFIGFSDTWLLIINTIATINASLMVIIIQNSQNRESKALHLKLDDLLASVKEAEKELIAIEQKEEAKIEELQEKLKKKHKKR